MHQGTGVRSKTWLFASHRLLTVVETITQEI
jgi:hypothetical protein